MCVDLQACSFRVLTKAACVWEGLKYSFVVECIPLLEVLHQLLIVMECFVERLSQMINTAAHQLTTTVCLM